jgi:outer membrane lipoprotein-sorting protein
MQRRRPPRARRPERRRFLATTIAALGLAGVLVLAPHDAQAEAFDLGALTTLLGRVQSGEATFVETRRIEMLDRTLQSSGRLSFKAPDSFVRETLKPRHEKLAVDGNNLTMSQGERSRTMQLDASPEAAVIVEAVRGTLTGNRATLERLFETTVSGDARAWTLKLVPRDLRLRGQVSAVQVSGREAMTHEVQVQLADGDRSVMTIESVATRGPS